MKNISILLLVVLLVTPFTPRADFVRIPSVEERIEAQTIEQINILKEIKDKQDETNKLLQELIVALREYKESNDKVAIKFAEFMKKMDEKNDPKNTGAKNIKRKYDE